MTILRSEYVRRAVLAVQLLLSRNPVAAIQNGRRQHEGLPRIMYCRPLAN
jgi:hypothetical protein